MKSIFLITVFVVVIVATQAEAQIVGLPLTNVINVIGSVSCSVNGSIVVNVTNPPPPFSNALVQLQCGGILRGVAVTNGTGGFSIIVSPGLTNITRFLQPCGVVVATPLSSCNVTLPSTGTLQTTILQAVQNTVLGLLNITTVEIGPLQLTASV